MRGLGKGDLIVGANIAISKVMRCNSWSTVALLGAPQQFDTDTFTYYIEGDN